MEDNKNEDLRKIKNAVRKCSSYLPNPMIVKFDDNNIDSIFGFTKFFHKPIAVIGLNFKDDSIKTKYSFDTKLVIATISLFHEYRHMLQYKEKEISEIQISIKMRDFCPGFNKLKYRMLPQELDAEIYGIQNAKTYINEQYPNINFENCLLESVNNSPQWYGDNSLKENRPLLNSYEEVMGYLYDCKKRAYNFPSKYEYNGFSTKLESIRVANLDSGAEQIYLIVKDLYLKGQASEELYNATLNLMNKYQRKEESIEDIYLNLPKENSATTNTFLMENKEIDNETIDTQRNL